MVEALCNKCRAAPPLSGDSWCLACTACESISCELRSRWGSHELRRLAADELVDQSKAIKTLRILSLRLRFEGADRSGARSGPSTGAGVALGATGKAKPGPPPKAPPILKEATGKTPEVIEEEVEVEKYEEESEYSYETSEEEVDTWQEAERPPVERKPESPKKGAGSAEVAEDKKERKRKSRGEEKVESKASKKKEKKDKGEKTRSVFPSWAEGDSFGLEGGPDWHMVTPVRGDVAVVAIKDTDIPAEAEEEVAFLVMNRFVTPEGGMGLDVKSIGGSTPEVSRQFSSWFNRKQGVLHLCSSTPCTYSEDHYVHTTRARFFTREGFNAPYFGAAQRRQVGRWLGEGDGGAGESEVIEAGGESVKATSTSASKRKDKGKGDGSGRLEKPGQRPGALKRPRPVTKAARQEPDPAEEPPLKRKRNGGEQDAIDEDLTLESTAGVGGESANDLREKLDALRERLGARPKRRVSFAEDANQDQEPEEVLREAA
ncbi:unnamed protein product, partial [Durusdinium trenchii]